MQEFTGKSAVVFQLDDGKVTTMHLHDSTETQKLIEFMMTMITDLTDDVFDLNSCVDSAAMHDMLFPHE
jgi:hypothetical protein